jgi:hypothetical protein
MLFLYRPRETRMPFAGPRSHTEQAAYNRRLQQQFDSTRRVTPVEPAAAQHDPIAALKELGALRESGVLTETEFETAKSKLLGS